MGTWEKITIDDAKKHAVSRGGTCLSATYKNGKTKLKWKCECGYIWKASFTSMRCSNSWCKKCVENARKLSIKDMRVEALKHGGKCLSNKYINSRSKLKWKCKNKHVFIKRANDVRQGGWCRRCAIEASMDTIKDCHDIAIKNGGNCLSKNYVNSKSMLRWNCESGHIWCACLSSIKSGNWCRMCANYYSQKEVIELVEERDGNLVSISGHNITRNTEITYVCKKGHDCNIKLRSIVDGMGCKQCYYDSMRSSIHKMKKIAVSRGGNCLSKKYINYSSKLSWQCSDGHVWNSRPNDIVAGSWCPICKTKSQKILYEIISDIYGPENVKFNFREFDWLLNKKTNRRQEIDIFVLTNKLAIEYDGEQHFFPVKFNNMSDYEANKKLKETKARDRRKNMLISNNTKDVRFFIRFNYKDKLTKASIIKKLRKIGATKGYETK